MDHEGISPNSRSIEIKCNQSILSSQNVKQMCEVFGSVEKIEIRESSYIISFNHAAEAMIAKNTLSEVTAEDVGCDLSVDWFIGEDIFRVFEIIPTPEVFLPIQRKVQPGVKPEPPECLKYIARFPISIQDSEEFHLSEKLLGAKGCNFRKIVEICAKDFIIPERPKDLIKIKILKQNEVEVKLTSRYVQKFQTACGLMHELITVIFEEYKRYCEIQGINPSNLRLRKLEQIKGRSRIFREKKDNPAVYSFPGIQ